MAAESLEVASPHVALYGGKPTTTSQDVATYFGKEHRNVIRSIRELIQQIAASGPQLNSEPGYPQPERDPAPATLNFELVELPDEQGQMRTAYRMDRDAFTLLAMGFTGKVALKFKLAYIEAFNRMEERLRLQRASSPVEQLTTGLEHGRYLVAFEGRGKFHLQEVPMFSSVLDPQNLMQMTALIESLVPTEVLVPMLQAGIDRLSRVRKVLK
jgi:Rha family phage regulatory protein